MAQNNNDVDVLIDVKNAYFIGNYQQCINEAMKLKGLTPEQSRLRDTFVYRAYIVMKKFSVVMDEITANSPPELLSIRLLAEFLSFPSQRDAIVEKLDKQLSGGFDPENATVIAVAAMIYHHVANYEAALRVLHQGDHLECSALTIQNLLAIDRVDLAQKELERMQVKDEDAVLTQLANVWVNLFTGGEKYQEAYSIIQDNIDRYGSTPLLLNLLACCYAGQGKYHDVETVLQESLDKDPNNADTLINLFVNSFYVGKTPEVSNRYFSQLKDAHGNHPFVLNYYKKENEFDRVSKIFQHA